MTVGFASVIVGFASVIVGFASETVDFANEFVDFVLKVVCFVFQYVYKIIVVSFALTSFLPFPPPIGIHTRALIVMSQTNVNLT
jgi:hypothetical protein